MILRWHDDEAEDEDSITVTVVGMMYEACLVLCSTSTDTPDDRSRCEHRSRMYSNEQHQRALPMDIVVAFPQR